MNKGLKKFQNRTRTELFKYRIIFLVVFVAMFLHGMFGKLGTSDMRTFAMLGIYILIINLFRLKSRTTFIITLFLLLILYIEFLLHGVSIVSDKAAVWLVLFFIIGIVQQWNE